MGDWIIIPEKVVQGIKEVCFNEYKKEATPERVLQALSDFASDGLSSYDPALSEYYETRMDLLSSDTIKRALNGRKDGGVSAEKNFRLLDLLCFYAFQRNWDDTLKAFNISNEELLIRRTGIKEVPDINFPSESLRLIINSKNENNSFELFSGLRLLDDHFWSNFSLKSDDEKQKKLSRFFTHTDSTLVLEAIVNKEIAEPDDFIFVTDSDENNEESTIAQMLDIATSQSFSLIKIVSDGGVGKTTFLFWVAYKYHDKYNFVFLETIENCPISELVSLTSRINSNKPLILIFDNVADYDIATFLKKYIIELKRLGLFSRVVFLLADRIVRYNAQYKKGEIENLFSGNVQIISKIPVDIEAVFEKVYCWLAKDNPLLNDEEIKQKSKIIFCQNSTKSISESTFLLIKSLKLKNVITYQFDWVDWEKFIELHGNTYADLQYLFLIVACFYQFGIKLNVQFKSSYLGKANRALILSAITTMGAENSPICLKENNRFLSLKHEHIAKWFFEDEANRTIAQGFFRDFLEEINNEVAGKLVRKIRKASKLIEFKESCIGNELPPKLYLAITEKYIKKLVSPSEEEEKMLNEKGLTLVALERDEEAVETFEQLISKYPDNNHARDQLAKIYLRSPKTYQLALNKYFEIYDNGGYYALIEIRKLLRQCEIRNISLSYDAISEISLEASISIAKEYLDKGQLTHAIDILDNIINPDLQAAECYNIIGHYLKFSEETIKLKRGCYEKAAKITRINHNVQFTNQFTIDYAVFLYRIRAFSESNEVMKGLCSGASMEDRIQLNDSFKSKVGSISKLFFQDLPPKENIHKLREYLLVQSQNAAALINLKERSTLKITYGYLILRTVRFHSKYILPDVYYSSLVQLGYCFMQHAEKGWNNLPPLDNRLIAEHYFDRVMAERGYLEKNETIDMIKNLLNFKEQRTSAKALKLLNEILSIKMNKHVPTYYRYRGTAKRFLEYYGGAMSDYATALECSKSYAYSKEKDFNNDMCYTLNNIAQLICDCLDRGIVREGFTLEKAIQCCDRIEDYRLDFGPLKLTRDRIEKLRSQQNKSI